MPDAVRTDQDNDGFWTGVLVGGLLGTVAGIFLGGDDKSELKRKLKAKAYAIWDNLGDFTQNVKEKTVDIGSDFVEEAEEVGGRAEQIAQTAQRKIDEITTSAQQAVEQQVAQVKKTIEKTTRPFSKKFFFQKGHSLQKKAK